MIYARSNRQMLEYMSVGGGHWKYTAVFFNHPELLCFGTEGKHQCWFCLLCRQCNRFWRCQVPKFGGHSVSNWAKAKNGPWDCNSWILLSTMMSRRFSKLALHFVSIDGFAETMRLILVRHLIQCATVLGGNLYGRAPSIEDLSTGD